MGVEVLFVSLIGVYEVELRSRKLSASLYTRERQRVLSGNSTIQAVARLVALRKKTTAQFLLDDVNDEGANEDGHVVRTQTVAVNHQRERRLWGREHENAKAPQSNASGSTGSNDGARGINDNNSEDKGRKARGVSVSAIMRLEMEAAREQFHAKQLENRAADAGFCGPCGRAVTPLLLPAPIEAVYQVVDHDEGTRSFVRNMGMLISLESITGLFDLLENHRDLLLTVRYGFLVPVWGCAILYVHLNSSVASSGSAIRRYIFSFTSSVLPINVGAFIYILLMPPWDAVDQAGAVAKVCCCFIMIFTDARLPVRFALA